MQVIDWEQFLKNGLPLNEKKTSMTVGIFDGVHLGHQALLKRVVSYNADYIPVVLTFKDNHKTKISEDTDNYKDIQSFKERIDKFKSLGIQITIVIDFNEEFKHMPGIEFLKLLLNHGSVGFFAAGSNFRCGFKMDTNAEAIKKFFASHNVCAEVVPDVCYPLDDSKGSKPISSSRIREAIAAGNIELAEKMLER